MFLAVSSVGKALSSGHIPYVEPDDYYYPSAPSAWDSLWGCASVTSCISTCVEYLKGHQDTPSSECCLNMRFLVSLGVRQHNSPHVPAFRSNFWHSAATSVAVPQQRAQGEDEELELYDYSDAELNENEEDDKEYEGNVDPNVEYNGGGVSNTQQVRVGVEVVDDPQAGEIHVTQPDEFIARPTQKKGNSLTPLGIRISWGSPT
nr:hypothetical protein Itr_chr09CG18700 [Ipomoea trifida]